MLEGCENKIECKKHYQHRVKLVNNEKGNLILMVIARRKEKVIAGSTVLSFW
jgi:ribosomal protein L44E